MDVDGMDGTMEIKGAATIGARPLPWWKRTETGVALLALLVLAVYWPVADGGLIWDDSVMLTAHPIVQSPDGWWKVWVSPPTNKTPDYFPLTSLLFWVQYHVWGTKTGCYHAVNVVLHFVNCLLLWRLLARLRIPVSWLVAALFAVHPVNVPSVAWVAELKNTLSLPFYLGAILAYLRFEDEGGRRRYAGALALFTLGCLAKSSMVVLPPALLLLAWWRRGRITKQDVLRSLPFFALALASGIVTMCYQYRPDGGLPVSWGWQLANGLAVMGRAVWFYLGHDLWPVNSCAVYPLWGLDLESAATYLPTLALAALFALLLWKRNTAWGRPLLFGLGYFVITMLPLLGFLPTMYMQFSFVADHWQYLSLPGVIALPVAAGVAAARWTAALPARGGKRRKAAALPSRPLFPGMAVLAAVALAVLASLSCRYAWVYSDAMRLWRDTMERNPEAYVAYNNYANDALARSQCSLGEAASFFREAVRRNPGYSEGWKNLAQAYSFMGRTDQAIDACRHVRLAGPRGVRVRTNLATDVLVLYGALVKEKGDVATARDCLRQALQLDPGCAAAQFNLALLEMQAGNPAAAAAGYRILLEQTPGNRKACNNLAWILAATPAAALRNPREAERLARRALAMADDDNSRYSLLDTLATAQAAAGRFPEAVKSAQRAVGLARRVKVPPAGIAELEERLELYRKGLPFRDRPPAGESPGAGPDAATKPSVSSETASGMGK